MSANLSYLCRLCLKTSEFKFSLFTGNILQKIESLTSIKIQQDDKLPNTCCETCVANVYTSYKFQQCIIESDKSLREKMLHNESHIIEQAKQAPDLFEVLHVEGTSDSADTAMIEQLEPKSENLEDADECNYVEFQYKVEEVEATSEHNNESDDVTDNYVLKNLLNSTSSAEDDKNNSEDLRNESSMEYIDVDNFVDNLATTNGNHAGDNIFSDKDVKEEHDGELATYVTDLEDSGSNIDVNKLCNKLDFNELYKKRLDSYKNKRKSSNEDNSSTGYAEDILTKLGIQSKFVEKFAAYREKQRNIQATLECVDCDIKFDSKRMLQRHMMKHKIDKCPFCSITMRSDNLKRHIQIHTDSPEVCDICGKIAKNKESLRGHVNYQHKNSETIKCETCNREFKSNHHYKTHVKKIHLGIRNHQCHICGKKFFANHDLNKHINMTHRGARPYVCQYCKKGFSSPYARKTHIRQHTLETPYRCEICAAGFRQKVSLVTHMKSKHSAVDKSKSNAEDVV